MPLDFPTSPTNGQAYNGYVYSTSVGAWQAKPAAQSPFYTSDTPPGNPVAGDSWFNTNDGTMYIYYNDGNTSQWTEHRSEIARSQVGLVPIVPSSISVGSGTATVSTIGYVSYTGVSSVSLNNVFTTAYDYYKINFSYEISTNASNGLRLRTGTTDNSTSNYVIGRTYQDDNTGGFQNTGLSAQWGTTPTASVRQYNCEITLVNPKQAAPTQGWHMATTAATASSGSKMAAQMGGMLFQASTSFDGLTLFPNAGTMTGTIQVLGFNK